MFSLFDMLDEVFDPDLGPFKSATAPVYAFCSMFILGLFYTLIGFLSYTNHDTLAILLILVSAIYVILIVADFFKRELIKSFIGILSFIYMLVSIVVIISY